MEREEKYTIDGFMPDPASTSNAEFMYIRQLLTGSVPAVKTEYSQTAMACHDTSEETAIDVHGLKEWLPWLSCSFPRSTRTIAWQSPNLDGVCCCRRSFLDGIMYATDVMIGGAGASLRLRRRGAEAWPLRCVVQALTS